MNTSKISTRTTYVRQGTGRIYQFRFLSNRNDFINETETIPQNYANFIQHMPLISTYVDGASVRAVDKLNRTEVLTRKLTKYNIEAFKHIGLVIEKQNGKTYLLEKGENIDGFISRVTLNITPRSIPPEDTILLYGRNRTYLSQITLAGQKLIVEAAAKELGKAPGSMIGIDYEKRFHVFGGKSLVGFLGYYHNRGQRDLSIIHEELGIKKYKPVRKYYSFEEALNIFRELRNSQRIFWENVSIKTQRRFIELAAHELRRSPGELVTTDYLHKFNVFNGKSLAGLVNFYLQKYKLTSFAQTIIKMNKAMGIKNTALEKKGFVERYDDPKIIVKIAPNVFQVQSGELALIDRESLLDSKQEIALCKEKNKGNRSALNAFLLANQNLVMMIIKQRYSSLQENDKEDVTSVGTLALRRSAELYDGRSRFATYAYIWIHSRCSYFIKTNIKNRERSLNEKLHTDSDVTLCDLIPDNKTNFEERLLISFFNEQAVALIKNIVLTSDVHLPDRTLDLDIYLHRLYGETLNEIGKQYGGRSREGIRQVCLRVSRVLNADPRYAELKTIAQGIEE